MKKEITNKNIIDLRQTDKAKKKNPRETRAEIIEKAQPFSFKKHRRFLAWVIIAVVAAPFAVLGGFYFYYNNLHPELVFPGVKVAGINLGGQTEEKAYNTLLQKTEDFLVKDIIFKFEDKEWRAKPADFEITVKTEQAAREARQYGRDTGFWQESSDQARALLGQANLELPVEYNKSALQAYHDGNLKVIGRDPIDAQLEFDGGVIKIKNSEMGDGASWESLTYNLTKNAANLKSAAIDLFKIDRYPAVNNAETAFAQVAAKTIIKDPLVFKYEGREWKADPEDMARWLQFSACNPCEGEAVDETAGGDVIITQKSAYISENNLPANNAELVKPDDAAVQATLFSREDEKPNLESFFKNQFTGALTPEMRRHPTLAIEINTEKMAAFLTPIKWAIDIKPQNAKLKFSDGQLSLVADSKKGRELDLDKLVSDIENKITTSDREIVMETREIGADITENNFSQLGIKDLIGQGTSNFSGSPANRRYNIAVGASKFDSALIKPGEEFSFLEQLGPVNAATGYKPELVIKGKKVVPDYGGGICQVSTTAFRAAVKTGLKITARTNHSFAVSYYSPQGTDATVYHPSPDLRFVNDTPNYILIQTYVSGNTLTFNFYGTDDGREVQTVGPSTYYRGPDGSSKASWGQIVKRSGQIIREQTFTSFYKPASEFSH